MANGMDLYGDLAQFSSDIYGQVVMTQSSKLIAKLSISSGLFKVDPQNVFMSPLSIHVALLMTLVGAGGQTRQELRQTLRIPPELEGAALHDVLGSALKSISTQSTDVTASLANRLFVLQNVNIREEFRHTLCKDYSAETESLVNYADTGAKRQRINQWVSEMTNSRIPELLPPGSPDMNSLLTLVNTVYFKGLERLSSLRSWKRPFDKQMTTSGLFYRMDGSTVEVPMMTTRKYFPYQNFPELDAVAVKLPFGDPASFVSSQEVDLKLPRFKLSESPPLNMKMLLQLMGVTSLFEKTADLSNLSPDANICVSDLVHKAVIKIDEQGAEAAAGSGVEIGPASIPETMKFHVDHLLALVYSSTFPAFIGHVFDPEVA
ncbi:serine proteinase inhibitor [Opisthorchis viverrini]|uniref:Serine proteinase inhibitor n=1 Tax=Opisthorchis viverrini TaxID=6198 RepID=A0A1S8WKZ0_OPIVI|nr:serine proteinase inhibitor [Opisthorchis viverrini]